MTSYLLGTLTVVVLFGAMSVSFNLLIGYGKLFSIAHGAFVGIGAYSVAILATNHGLPFPVAVLTGVAIGVIVGYAIGLITLRVSEDFLAIATFAFQFVFTSVVTNLRGFTGGAYGIPAIRPPALGNWEARSPLSQLIVGALVLLLCVEVTRRLRASPFGLTLRASGEDEGSTRALGQSTRQAKIHVHAISAGLAALAGGFYAAHIGFIVPASFDIHFSILLLAMVIIGGAGSVVGPAVGAAIVVGVPEMLNFIGATNSTIVYARGAGFGILLLVVVLGLRRGIVKARPYHPAAVSGPPTEEDESAAERPTGIGDRSPGSRASGAGPLESRGVSKHFGGIAALNDVTVTIEPREVLGIVGPNGAGKTTLFDVLTGFIRPETGSVALAGASIDSLPPPARARKGVVRSFQNLRLFPHMTVLENVMVAVPLEESGPLTALLSRRKTGQSLAWARADAERILERVGLTEMERTAAELSYAEQKMLSLARVLAARPHAVLLDEPASGLDPQTSQLMIQTVRQLAQEGRAVCVVEHNTQILKEMADRMVFMHLGTVMRSGLPDEIMTDAELGDIYFGVAKT